ncbi:MAG: class I SAM-dependent methyltransferase [Caldilineaceae bacterium]|nr:class I SAM-dependent methyltransferase [Caldilineaceae bacterium]
MLATVDGGPGIRKGLSEVAEGAGPAESASSVWKDPGLVKQYLLQARKGLPLAQIQLDVMMRVVSGAKNASQLGEQPVRNFLDLGCGDGILAATILEKYPQAKGTLVDFSMPMIQAAIRNLQAYSKSLHISSVDYSDPAWFDIISAHAPFDAVVSGFSIHHQPDPVKSQLYLDIFDLLEPGGVFVNIEHVSSATPYIEALYDDYFIDSLWASQLTEGEAQTRDQVAYDYRKREDKKANILAPVELQCDWLRRIGFEDVDCYFKVFELAVFGGRRPRPSVEDEDWTSN